MFRKLIEAIKSALANTPGTSRTLKDAFGSDVDYTISIDMQNAIDDWTRMYQDQADWLDDLQGIYSLGLPKEICQNLQIQVLSEMDVTLIEPKETKSKVAQEDLDSNTKEPKNRASLLRRAFNKGLMPNLPNALEKGMATGGLIIRPYVNDNKLYFDFNVQGEFIPLSFNDDGDITDIAFIDQFTDCGKRYTKIERQTWDGTSVTVINKGYMTKTDGTDNRFDDIGEEVPLSQIERWSDLAPYVTIKNCKRPLYGYYKTTTANNIDMDSPLGISIFEPARAIIKRADMQFSRLDWEFEGGQLAIDVDPSALHYTNSYWGQYTTMDTTAQRLYRDLDLGEDNTYNAFAPVLRSTQYIEGLNKYLERIEDLCGIARGTISEITGEAKTATELRIMKQRSYITISSNQNALQRALNDVVLAMNRYADIYSLTKPGEYSFSIEWKDNVLTDTDVELQQKLLLVQEGVLSKTELRAWYTGEDELTAEARCKEIETEALDRVAYMGNLDNNNGNVYQQQIENRDKANSFAVGTANKTSSLPKDNNKQD